MMAPSLPPLIFLDIDGVLVTPQSPNMRSPTPRCVARLNELCAATGAMIVVSSTWRMGKTVEDLDELLHSWGVRAPVVAKTAKGWGSDRGIQIAEYLGRLPHTPPFVIIDDDSDMDELLPRLVKTSWRAGLSRRHVRAAKRMDVARAVGGSLDRRRQPVLVLPPTTNRQPRTPPMRFTFTVEVEVEHMGGKILADSQLAVEIREELKRADPNWLSGVDDASMYEVSTWEVRQP